MEPSAEIRDITLRFYQALSKGDMPVIERLFSRHDGVVLIGTDPAEWWTDHAAITRVFKAQMEEMGGGFVLVAGEVHAYGEGAAGWVADRPKIKLPDGSELPLRVTGAFLKEDGEWKLVSWHASIGVKNEEAFGAELTT